MGNVKSRFCASARTIETPSRLKETSMALLEKYGSQSIKAVKFRDSYVMIGQKGLARGKAIELVRFTPHCP